MKSTILPALATIALALIASIAAAQGVPTLDVGPLCRAEAKAAKDFSQNCLSDQKAAREDLVRQWAKFSPESRTACTQMVNSIPGTQSYVELLTCLQMKRDVKNIPKE